jgi:hypothetical protein
MSDKHQEWARLGAASRLREIEEERQEILAAFPELKSQSAMRADGSPRRKMSPEARKRMSAGMRRFWAKRKAAGKSSGKSA